MGDWTSHTWVGAVGAGVSGSVLVGGSAYQVNLWRLDGRKVPMMVMITGVRAGLMAEVGTGHMVCILQNVKEPSDFNEIKSSGLDWSFGSGVDWDSMLKTSTKVAAKIVEFMTAAGAKGLAKVGNHAANEGVKKAIQGFMGDYDIKPKDKAFMMLPTPLAASVGGGVFYEWQWMSKVGTNQAYKYIKPKWRVETGDAGAVVYVDNIPEQDGTRICMHVKIDVIGYDDTIVWANRDTGRTSMEIYGTVKNGQLCEDGSPGIALGWRRVVGIHKVGWTSNSTQWTPYANKSFGLGLAFCRGLSGTNLYKWEADDYAKCKTDANGIVKSADMVKTLG